MTLHVHQLAQVDTLPTGTFLFTDLERQTQAQRELQGQVWDSLAATPGNRLLNHPIKAMGRRMLLDELHRTGSNAFSGFGIKELDRTIRYPVFLRIENDHQGGRTPLIENRVDLDDQIVRALMAGADPEKLLVVEFVETGDAEGIYRKYSAFRFGERIVPRHLIFSREWMLKQPDLLDDAKLAEERAYLDANPHEAELRRIFELAHIDYGRIDYALADGKIQVWEINTNPIVTLPVREYKQAHLSHQEWFAERALAAFEALDSPASTQKTPIRLRFRP